MLKVDLHNHTNYIQPWETNYSPKELIDEAIRKGYDAICLSEHYAFTRQGELLKEYRKDPFASYRDFREYASKKGLLLISAVEVKYREGEVLLVNFKGNIKDYSTIESLKNLPKEVLVVAPHPFFKRGFCLGDELIKNIDLFDAIEYSHFYIKFLNLNKEAVKVAKRYHKVLLGTSDAHRLEQLGHTYSLVDAKKDAVSIVKAIKLGKVKLVTNPLPFYIFIKIIFRSIYSVIMLVPLILYRWIKL